MAGAAEGTGGDDKPLQQTAASASHTSLDVSKGERQSWLLKVPPRVSSAWQTNSESASCLAKIVISVDPTKSDRDASMQLSLELPPALAPQGMPKFYELNATKDVVPMYAFSETPQGKATLEGKVGSKFDMKPNNLVSDEYRKLCRERLDKSKMKTRTVQVLENDHGGLMRPSPVAVGPMYAMKKKPVPKAPETKRIRIERGDLEDIVFKLFEQQPYWTLKQLVAETQQPEAFMKEVMSDLCVYNKRGPNQGKYELKPEYIRKPSEEEKPAE